MVAVAPGAVVGWVEASPARQHAAAVSAMTKASNPAGLLTVMIPPVARVKRYKWIGERFLPLGHRRVNERLEVVRAIAYGDWVQRFKSSRVSIFP
jgi:hypothetical protein